MTPAQAYGHPNFVTDVPVQGPTDEGLRAASCWWAQNRLPAQPACVDCNGPVPQWARNSLCPGNRLTNSGLGEGFMERISFGGVGVAGFALGGPGDPDIFAGLAAAQQSWVQTSLATLNSKIMSASGTSCPTWVDPGVNLKAAVGCFQSWWNTNFAGTGKPGKPLRNDGAFDEDTLCALQTVASMHPADFAAVFPDTTGQFCKPSAPVTPGGVPAVVPATTPATTEKKGLSTGAMVGIGLAGAAVVGGGIYLATRGGSKRRR